MFDLSRPPTAQLLPRREQLAHNARWHLIDAGLHRKIGWGDLSLADLHQIRTQLDGRLFVAARESADWDGPDAARWGNYDEPGSPDPSLTAADIAAQALFAVTAEGGVLQHRSWGEAPGGSSTALPGTRLITTVRLTALVTAHGRPTLAPPG